MSRGIALLTLAYVFSQFFRAFLAVLTDVLGRDLGASAEQLATASGLWFLSFALMQVPVGWALDRIGPRRTAGWLFLLGGTGGAAVFALATTPLHVQIAMLLIGVGCSPVLMAPYYIFARTRPARQFATLAATVIGVGSLGNLAGSAPLAWLVEAAGWRSALWMLSGATALVALAILAAVEDPPPAEQSGTGSLLDLLKLPALWLILPMVLVGYAPAAGLRGLWAGPYLRDAFGADTITVGNVTLAMSVAMIAGTFLYGPLDRWLGTRKWVAFVGNAVVAVALALLWWGVAGSVRTATILLCVIGAFGMAYPVLMAHGRSFAPPHLVGRGVTLLNLFSIGGTGLAQLVTGRLFAGAQQAGASGAALHQPIFGFFLVAVLCGLAVYLFCRDRLD